MLSLFSFTNQNPNLDKRDLKYFHTYFFQSLPSYSRYRGIRSLLVQPSGIIVSVVTLVVWSLVYRNMREKGRPEELLLVALALLIATIGGILLTLLW